MPGSRIGLNSLVGDIKDAVNFTSTRTRGKLPQTGVGVNLKSSWSGAYMLEGSIP